MLNFNTEPYNDDYDVDNKFYRILFRPSFAVQARELTQLQTILQGQVTNQANHIFKQGAMVVPGQVSIDTKVHYVKLASSYNAVVTESFIQNTTGKFITGANGVKAQIINVVSSTTTDPTTIYVRYLSSGTNNTTKVFADGEVIDFDDGTDSVQAIPNVTPGTPAATGLGSTATIQRGIYYVNGHFVLCADPVTGEEQVITLSKYSSTPSYRIGLNILESVIVPEDDETLLDNAQTSYNFAAPGAHRYHIDLILARKALDNEDDENFVELLRVVDGQIERIVTKTEYSELEKTFARRTYDESGNYDVRPFTIDVREARNNNRGTWTTTATAYLIGDIVKYGNNHYTAKNTATSSNSVPPTHTSGTAYDGSGSTGVNWEYTEAPNYNRGVSLSGSDNQLAIALDPGKAYVQGYEIEKVSTSYVYIDKARDASHTVQVDNAIIPQTVGNYVLVNSINSAPPVHTFATVSLYNRFTTTGLASPVPGTGVGTLVGTARVRFIEWHNGTIGTTAAQYKLGLFDIQMISGYDFKQNVKSVYFSGGSTATSFSADILPVATRLIGSATAATSTTVTGTGTSFQTDLVVGDYISLGGTYRRVTAIASQVSLTIDAAATVTGVTIDRVTTEIKEPNNETLIFPFPYYAIKSARAADNTNQTTYAVYERFTGTTSSGSGGFCTLTVSTGSGTMGSGAETDNYQLIDNTTGLTVAIDPTNIATSGSSVTFTLADTYASRAFIVIGTVTKTLASTTEKTKTLTNTSVTFTTQALATNPILSLGVADGYRIISIKKATGFAFGSSPTSSDYTTDISDHYNFDDGQTPTFYGLAKLVLKPSFTAPNAPVRVEFEYFAHGTGDYFTVNSYSDIDYKKIPTFGPTQLRDSIDFRPRVDTTGLAYTGSGASTSLVPKRGIDIQSDFQYYLARTDKIALDFNGNFFSITGVPSLNPGLPEDPSLGMVLYTIQLEPYTFGTKSTSVIVTKHDNKRYTMRDIGKLEKRIDNLEYYTSLTLLEQETQSLEIIDSTTGLNRFKNGFIVDNFSGHSTGDVVSSDYFCAIDMENNELRPFYSMKNINLIEKETTTAGRTSANYKLYGDVITLPLIDQPKLVDQPYASRTENINPFAIFTFLGNIDINPSSDEWFETDRRPDIVQNEEGDFNAIATLAEKAGVLGTVWNSWQNQYLGEPIRQGSIVYTTGGNWASRQGDVYLDQSQLQERFGITGWGNARQITVETFAQQVNRSRTGINTRVVAKIDKRQVEDKVLSSAVIPYIRSRNILIQARGLKPSTKFTPFFDNVDVSDYCTPATKITYTGAVNFDHTTNVGGNAVNTARRISGDTQVCLNRGDIITGTTSGATAVVVGSDKTFNTSGVVTGRAIYVVNISGTFQSAETITGSVSGVSATVGTVSTTAVAGDDVITNANGEAQLLFNIPQGENLRFRTGQREFVLSDASTAPSFDYTSRGKGNYYAQGILETKQATFIATRNGVLASEPTSQNDTITQTSERIVSDTGWWDPLAQTFLVQQEGGAFLTKVDVYFATKDANIPVNLEIREVVNGYPGKYVLPFSKVSLKPENVNISTNTVDMPDGTVAKSYDTPTTFTFPSPVYVQNNQEYCLVLSSDSNGYNVWISNTGDKIPNSSRFISEQPYAGVLFKSQNGSTWTANQDQDLKFTIYRAKFDTSVVGAVEFINDVLPTQILDKDPFETNTGTPKVKVYQKNHGFAASSYVTISNSDTTKINGVAASAGTITCSTGSTTVTGSSTVFETDIGTTTIGKGDVLRRASDNAYIGIVSSVASNTSLTLVSNAAITISSGVAFKIVESINGVPSTEVYKSHTITSIVDNDSYVVTCTNNATARGYAGGLTVTANQNAVYNAVQPIVQSQNFSDTTAVFSMKTTSGKSVNGSESPYAIDANFSGIIPNDTNYFSTPRLIASEQNQSSLLSGNPSATLLCQMSTDNDALSPIIDTHRVSLVAISNTINSPSESTINQSALDDITLLSANTTIAFTTATNACVISSTNATARGLLQTIQVGKFITVSGAGSASNNGTFRVTKVVDDGTTTSVTVFNTGASASAGATVTIVLRNQFVDEISPLGSSTHSKYVTKKIGLTTPATTLKIRLAVNVPTKSNLKVYYKTSAVGNKNAYSTINYAEISPDNLSSVPKVEYGNTEFTDVDFTLTDITPFDAFTVKLVMTSTNSSEIPKAKDLRVIACS
jgi:hypothetical protein